MIPCHSCAAPCCRNYHIGIYAWDAYRIASVLSVPMADLCQLTWLDHSEGDYRIVLDGSVEVERRRHHSLEMRKIPDPDPKYHGRCTFLVTVGDRGRCGIYSVRPDVCRVYPTTSLLGVIGVDGGGRYCPPGSWQLVDIDEVLARRRWAGFRSQRELHNGLTDAWNKRVIARREARDAAGYLGFLRAALERLLESDADLFAEGAVFDEARARAAVGGVVDALGWSGEEPIDFPDPHTPLVHAASPPSTPNSGSGSGSTETTGARSRQ